MSAEHVVQHHGAAILLACLAVFTLCRLIDTAVTLKRYWRDRELM